MLIHWIWLATRPELSGRDKLALLQHFGDPEDIFYADKTAFQSIEELTQAGAAALADKDLHEAGSILRTCTDSSIRLCTFSDSGYPARLKNIADPPLVLYYKGYLPDWDRVPVISIVGTRKASAYGLNVARKMGSQIARCGGIVVSGIASGVDAAAMSGALTAGGCAVGILGNGVDIVYPVINRSLFADTQRYGCLISEFPPGTPPHKWNFPKRNRVISGMANGVLIVEAPERSGALITARQAAEQGRDVFVVPGNVDVATCIGSNNLLREGAIAVRNGWDVVSEYCNLYPDTIRRYDQPIQSPGFTDSVIEEEKPLPKVAQTPRSPQKAPASDKKNEKKPIDKAVAQPYSDIQATLAGLSQEEQAIAVLLLDGECLVDDVIARSGMPVGQVLSLLTLLELQNIVIRKPGKRVALK